MKPIAKPLGRRLASTVAELPIDPGTRCPGRPGAALSRQAAPARLQPCGADCERAGRRTAGSDKSHRWTMARGSIATPESHRQPVTAQPAGTAAQSSRCFRGARCARVYATGWCCWWTTSTPLARPLLPAAGCCCGPAQKRCGWPRWRERSVKVLRMWDAGALTDPQAKQWGHDEQS